MNSTDLRVPDLQSSGVRRKNTDTEWNAKYRQVFTLTGPKSRIYIKNIRKNTIFNKHPRGREEDVQIGVALTLFAHELAIFLAPHLIFDFLGGVKY